MLILWAKILEFIIGSLSSCPNNKLYNENLDFFKNVDRVSKSLLSNYYNNLQTTKTMSKRLKAAEIYNYLIYDKRNFHDIPKMMIQDRQIINNVLDQCDGIHEETLRGIYGFDKTPKDIHESVSYDIDFQWFHNADLDKFKTQFRNFVDGAKRIDYLYIEFLKFHKDPMEHSQKSRQNFIDTCFSTSSDGSPLSLLTSMLTELIENKRGVFYLLRKNTVENYILATRRLSTLEYMHNLAVYYITIEIKAALILTGGKSIANLTDINNNYEDEYANYIEEMMERLIGLIESLIQYAPKCSGKYWIYDTHKHKIGNQFATLSNFLKGFYFRDTNCSYIGNNAIGNKYKDDRGKCEVKNYVTCNGKLHCIQESDNSSYVNICYSNIPNRHYDYVSFGKNETKNTKACSGAVKTYKPNNKCVDCSCYCEETDTFISLDELVSDTKNNRIITGVRFAKYNGIITMDIQETELNYDGSMRESSSKWIINKANKKFKFKYAEKQQFHIGTLTSNHRVVTGIRFVEVTDGIQLQIRVNDLENCSRKIVSKKFKWIEMKGLETRFWTDIPLVHPSIGEKLHPASFTKFRRGKITITTTSFESDGAQTVVPFFDTRQVVPVRPLPLCGIGLFYKTSSIEYGGFIAPYLIIADYSSEIESASTLIHQLKSRLNGTIKIASNFFLIIGLILLFV